MRGITVSRAAAPASLLLLFLFLTGVPALQNVKVSVPEAAAVGDTVTLYCHYDLEADSLYSIKWYKGRKEFYRYIPKELPHIRVFPVAAIEVDTSRSGPTTVVLRKVSTDLSGRYYCEVSADAPSFHTMMSMGTLNVVVLPEDAPIIVSEKKRVAVGETLQTFCIGPPTNIKMNFTILINQKKVPKEYVSSDMVKNLMQTIRLSQIANQEDNSLEQNMTPSTKNIVKSFTEDLLKPEEDANRTASIALIPVTPDLFHDNRLKVSCKANIFSLYSAEAHIDLEEDKPQIALILGNQNTPNGGESCKWNLQILSLTICIFVYHLKS